MSELITDCIRHESTPSGLIQEPQYVDYLRTQGYTIESIVESHREESQSRDGCHMVLKIETYLYPVNHPRLDYEQHRITLWVCSCEGFTYQYAADVSTADIRPTDCDSCPHIERVSKVERAKADDNQETLIETL